MNYFFNEWEKILSLLKLTAAVLISASVLYKHINTVENHHILSCIVISAKQSENGF